LHNHTLGIDTCMVACFLLFFIFILFIMHQRYQKPYSSLV
jgi:hypothetical protein